MQGRRRKRYGAVTGLGRGVAQHVRDKYLKKVRGQEARETYYSIPAGTPCEVRKEGAEKWRPHKIQISLIMQGFLWRNETHYGFAHRGWELKVAVADLACP